MILSIREIFDILVMTVAVGYIFMDMWRQFGAFGHHIGFDVRSFKMACIATAPALIVHELFHKFVALAFGLFAVFHASYFWLIFGVILKSLNSPLLFFVPAYVSIDCAAPNCIISPLSSALVAFAGPFANLLLFVVSKLYLRNKRLPMKKRIVFYVTQQINLFLFIFNMLPFPLFDGFKVYEGLFLFLKPFFG